MVKNCVGKHYVVIIHLHFSDEPSGLGNIITCVYFKEIQKYLDKFQVRYPIYFDHKMATFNSTVPIILVLGIVCYPNSEASRIHHMEKGVPIFTGPLINNPNNVTFSQDELKTMIRDFGYDSDFNYYFFDRFIRPHYKLKIKLKKTEYIKKYNNCEKIGNNECNCLPTCQWIGEKGGRKIKSQKYRNSCVDRKTWKGVVKARDSIFR